MLKKKSNIIIYSILSVCLIFIIFAEFYYNQEITLDKAVKNRINDVSYITYEDGTVRSTDTQKIKTTLNKLTVKRVSLIKETYEHTKEYIKYQIFHETAPFEGKQQLFIRFYSEAGDWLFDIYEDIDLGEYSIRTNPNQDIDNSPQYFIVRHNE